MLMGIMGHFTDDEAYPIVAACRRACRRAATSRSTTAPTPTRHSRQAQQGYNDSGAVPYYLRSPARFTPFFEGLELVEPGLVPVPHWRPDPGAEPVEIYSYCGVGRKP